MRTGTNLNAWLVMSVFMLSIVGTSQGGTIYVDDDASLGGNGQSWATAYKYLQDALADANVSGDDVWVAEGIYKPDQGGGQDPNDREASFQPINGVAIYGGFPSYGEPNWEDRDPNIYETILSGDLDGNDIDVNAPCDLPNEPTRGENSHHVVSGSETDANAVLDGFTITAGNADGSWPQHDRGGGMYNSKGSPTVTNCFFSSNYANYGAGMYNDQCSTLITNCVFSGNDAVGDGGGVRTVSGSVTLINCTFHGNTANDGGGMYNSDCFATVTNCIVWDNTATTNPEIANYNSHPFFIQCDIQGCGGSSSWNWPQAWDGGGNIDSAPSFLDELNPAGTDGSFGTLDDGLQLDGETDACIDAANGSAAPSTDILGHGRIDIIDVVDTGTCDPPYADIGAYEFKGLGGKVVVMVWIDESASELGKYHVDGGDETFKDDYEEYINLITSNNNFLVKSGCLVPLPSGGLIEFTTIEGVLPIDYFDPPVPEYISPCDPPAGTSIYEFPRSTDPELTLDTFKNHFYRICDGVVPDYLCLSVDNSGSMTTNTINPYDPDPALRYPYNKFITWLDDTYGISVNNGNLIRRDGADDFTNEQWVEEMTLQITNIFP